MEKKDEENWILKNVIFVEDIKTVPIGKVLKVSAAFCLTEISFGFRNLRFFSTPHHYLLQVKVLDFLQYLPFTHLRTGKAH